MKATPGRLEITTTHIYFWETMEARLKLDIYLKNLEKFRKIYFKKKKPRDNSSNIYVYIYIYIYLLFFTDLFYSFLEGKKIFTGRQRIENGGWSN